MVYGEEKARDMARSLLPSTRRKAARKHRTGVHREARRTARLEVARFERDPEAFDGAPGPEGAPEQEIRYMVQQRRWGDKVHPFIRWATAITRELPRESRLSHVQGLLPRGVIGEHALKHLEGAEAFEDPIEREWWELHWGQRRPQWRWMDRGEQAELLRAVLKAPGGHRAFNRWLQARHVTQYHPQGVPVGPTRARPLRGLHDVLPFLDEVGTYAPWYRGKQAWQPHPQRAEWFHATEDFLRAFKQCRGDVEATLAVLGVKSGGRGPSAPPHPARVGVMP